MATVFLSYRHEGEDHLARVRDLGGRLRAAGLTVILDQFAQDGDFSGAGPDEGWPRWSKSQAANPSHKILIVASAGWFRCYQGNELPGLGLGAAAEAAVIEQRLYNSSGVSADIRIAAFGPLDSAVIPLDLQRYHRFSDPTEFSAMAGWLSGNLIGPSTVVEDWPIAPPQLAWPLANQGAVRCVVERLLTQSAPWRLLLLRGSSESGKSHISKQILGNALRMPGLACGRFDFKGTTDVDAELRAFVQHLDVPLPPPSSRLNERLSYVLEALNRRARPALLVFDTYEAAGEAMQFIEKQLLQAIIPAAWLRIVIGGQLVPDRSGAAWASEACAPIQLVPPPPEDWFEFGRSHRRDMTLDFVRKAHECCGGKASLLAQLLGPE